MKRKPAFDRDGYPAEETLEIIKQWDMNPSTMKDLMAFIASAWHWDDMARETSPGLWVFATGGWSGNESLLSALQQSKAWWILSGNSLYLPGGMLIVAITAKARERLEQLCLKIVDWAWSGGILKSRSKNLSNGASGFL
jgi:hypothetical protein